jgi:hypothetical protein
LEYCKNNRDKIREYSAELKMRMMKFRDVLQADVAKKKLLDGLGNMWKDIEMELYEYEADQDRTNMEVQNALGKFRGLGAKMGSKGLWAYLCFREY